MLPRQTKSTRTMTQDYMRGAGGTRGFRGIAAMTGGYTAPMLVDEAHNRRSRKNPEGCG